MKQLVPQDIRSKHYRLEVVAFNIVLLWGKQDEYSRIRLKALEQERDELLEALAYTE